ncbi:MAG: hypothetical protein QMC67_07580 [Candidatus Wallbacteria bacterium]
MDIELLRNAELKAEFIEYAKSPKYEALHGKVLNTIFSAGSDVPDDGQITEIKPENLQPEEYYNFLDWFALELKLEDNQTILDKFINENTGKFTAADLKIIECWRNVFESLFKIESIAEDGFYAINILNLKRYFLKPTVSMEDFTNVEKGTLLWARIFPFKQFHVFSGAIVQLMFEDINDTINYVVEMVLERPQVYFQDNPEGIDAAFKLQNLERELFMEHFGDDMLILDGAELKSNYNDFYIKAAGDVAKLRLDLRKELLKNLKSSQKLLQSESSKPLEENTHEFNSILEQYTKFDSVGIIYDQKEGINFYPDFRKFEALFSLDNEETLEGDAKENDIIIEYLKNENISALPFKKMFEKYPDNFAFKMSSFFDVSPEKIKTSEDFDKHMTPFKSFFYKTIPMPSILPVELNDFIAEIVED